MTSNNKIANASFPSNRDDLHFLDRIISVLLRKDPNLIKFPNYKKASSSIILHELVSNNVSLNLAKTQNKQSRYSLYRYFLKKYRPEFYYKSTLDQENNQTGPDALMQRVPIKNLAPEMISRLLKNNCPICSDVLIKDFPINRKDELIEVIKESDLKKQISEKLSEKICLFGNKGLGYIYLVSAIEGDLIKEGFYCFSFSQKKILIEAVNTALNQIANKQYLTISTHRVSLVSSFDILSNSESSQFIIKLTISTVNGKSKGKVDPIFYKKAGNRSPQLPPIYLLYKKSSQQSSKLEVQNVIKQQIYSQIGRLIKGKQKMKKLSEVCSSCKNNTLELNLYNIQEVRKKPIFQKDSILYNTPLFFTSVCSNLKKSSIDQTFSPQNEKLRQVIILSIQRYMYFPQIQAKIQNFLQEYSIKYELYTPFQQIQLEVIRHEKEEQKRQRPLLMVLFLETCHFSNFNKFFSGKFSDTIHVLVSMIKGTHKIRLRNLIHETDLGQYLKTIEQKYSMQPHVSKIKFASKSEAITYKKVQAVFQKEEIKATIFSYFLFFLANKQPLFPKDS